MSNLIRLAELGDEFDRFGEHELADRVDSILKLAADANVDLNDGEQEESFTKEEHQRLLTVVFEHLMDLYIDVLPKIEYLQPFWDVIKSAIETARARTAVNIEDKTKAFEYQQYKKWAEQFGKLREKFANWVDKELTSARVLQERFLITSPLKRLINQLEITFADDEAMQALKDEWKRLLIVFDNIFEQTTGEIAGIPLKRSL